jgi:metal-responsive CopG/Arc/MetJ family transcriptional regulator
MPVGDVPRKPRQVRLQVSLPEAIIETIDDYKFASRAPNRSEAVRQLLKVGQAARPPEEQSD